MSNPLIHRLLIIAKNINFQVQKVAEIVVKEGEGGPPFFVIFLVASLINKYLSTCYRDNGQKPPLTRKELVYQKFVSLMDKSFACNDLVPVKSPWAYVLNLRNLNGNNIISSVESPDNPIFTERVLARYKTSTIVKIVKNVHIHASGVKR